MPIVEVEMVTDREAEPGLAQILADRIGEALRVPEGSTWVRLRRLPRASYAESGAPVASDIQPVFVAITAQRQPAKDESAKMLQDVTSVVADATGHPKDNVHVIFEPGAAGRIAFGGHLID